jgi:hypothetical protein
MGAFASIAVGQEPTAAFQHFFRFGHDFADEPESLEYGRIGSTTWGDPYADTELEISSLEVMKQFYWTTDGELNSIAGGWRLDGFAGDGMAGIGDETRGHWALNQDAADSLPYAWMTRLAESTRLSGYTTVGLRGIEADTEYYFLGTGSILGRVEVQQTIDQQAFGPQVGLGVVAEAPMFRLEAVALGLVGYGRAKYNQGGVIGEETVVPGALNRPINARTVTPQSTIQSDEEHVAWHGETRVTGSCQITQRLRFDVTWRWFVTGPIYDAGASVVWGYPSFGFQQTGGEAAYSSDWFLGLNYTW